ncbi:PTS transporter subunit EIIB [Mesomycoplasma lagogenitalium]|uniref:PTS transporter subunit EIIB n=1 Tax=Mesomycoplasma lagogenitalium TaxID=171286 RepID=A0ABY8LXF9_9BACT|nr:PTS transporter subunit EIIB [Mesomycoplasma lagogenitalium]WGI36956.1 PTS transporter subunit EIIB [Mesomycoplasma lagogenitalium]
MKNKDKILIVFLTIITLGFIWIYWKQKAKNNKENELSKTTKMVVDLDKLIENLGGKTNIDSLTNSHKRVKLYLNDSKKVNANEVQNMKGISGTLVSSKYIEIIVGNVAEHLANEVKRKLEK